MRAKSCSVSSHIPSISSSSNYLWKPITFFISLHPSNINIPSLSYTHKNNKNVMYQLLDSFYMPDIFVSVSLHGHMSLTWYSNSMKSLLVLPILEMGKLRHAEISQGSTEIRNNQLGTVIQVCRIPDVLLSYFPTTQIGHFLLAVGNPEMSIPGLMDHEQITLFLRNSVFLSANEKPCPDDL